MSFRVDWDIDKYKDDHESDDHWELRRGFMERWKSNYSEERLVCLARVFTNIELLGCRYPAEVMQEVASLSQEVAKDYRCKRKDKLKRTFVSASDAAEDRARGVLREAGVVRKKTARIDFVRQGTDNEEQNTETIDADIETQDGIPETQDAEDVKPSTANNNDYVQELAEMKCLNVRYFNERMFTCSFGRMVLLIRPWVSKLCNIQASCQMCGMTLVTKFKNNCYTLTLNDLLLAQATGNSKVEARHAVQTMAWDVLKNEVIIILMKEQWIAQGDARISVKDVSSKNREDTFGTPIENSVATKIMQLMGWKGGGLGPGAQGIAEPIKANLRMVSKAGLGCSPDIRHLRRAASNLMQRYLAADDIDVDLVFSRDFSKEERALMHQCAQKLGLASKSYGGDKDRFLVVGKKLQLFNLVQTIVEKGGSTNKYQLFLPANLQHR